MRFLPVSVTNLEHLQSATAALVRRNNKWLVRKQNMLNSPFTATTTTAITASARSIETAVNSTTDTGADNGQHDAMLSHSLTAFGCGEQGEFSLEAVQKTLREQLQYARYKESELESVLEDGKRLGVPAHDLEPVDAAEKAIARWTLKASRLAKYGHAIHVQSCNSFVFDETHPKHR